MSRIPRISGVLVVSAALVGTAVPSAQARTLARPQAASVSASWLDAALAWVGALGLEASPAARAHQAPITKATTLPIPPPDGSGPVGMRPMGCSTIDPNGATGPVICHGGGN